MVQPYLWAEHHLGAGRYLRLFGKMDERNRVVQISAAHEADGMRTVRVVAGIVSVGHAETQDVPVEGDSYLDVVDLQAYMLNALDSRGWRAHLSPPSVG
jgi:hypothetical protein